MLLFLIIQKKNSKNSKKKKMELYFDLIKELHEYVKSNETKDLHNLLTNLYLSKPYQNSNCESCFTNAWTIHSRNVQSLDKQDLIQAKCLNKIITKTWCSRQEILQDLHECLLTKHTF